MSDIGSGDEGISSQSTYSFTAAEPPKSSEFRAASVHRRGPNGGSSQRSKVNISLFSFQNGEFGSVGRRWPWLRSPRGGLEAGRRAAARRRPGPAGPTAGGGRRPIDFFVCDLVVGRAGVGGHGAPSGPRAAAASSAERVTGTAANLAAI